MKTSRILHTMLRVGDMRKSVDFYTRVLGLQVLRRFDQPTENYSLTFLGYAKEQHSCVLELTYNYGVTHYDIGNGYGHLAIGVRDCSKACAEISALGGEITMNPTRLDGLNEVIAFVRDPDGYQIELVERPEDWFIAPVTK
ncbi:MAG: lactoylglutathione lyase [Candidatus Thiodiazotropha sp.]